MVGYLKKKMHDKMNVVMESKRLNRVGFFFSVRHFHSQSFLLIGGQKSPCAGSFAL